MVSEPHPRERLETMTIKVTLSDDVANYLEEQSLAQNKSCDQLADELLRQLISPDRAAEDAPSQSETRTAPHHRKLIPALEGKSLNQVLDDLYIQDYFEKMRAED